MTAPPAGPCYKEGMPPAAASLGQLAVVTDVISREEHRELTRQMQILVRQGQPISYARLLVKRLPYMMADSISRP